jgi:hypothetical protein
VNVQIVLPADKFSQKERSSSCSPALTLGKAEGGSSQIVTTEGAKDEESRSLEIAPVHLVTPVRNSDSESDGDNSDYDLSHDQVL